jgi:Asp-tRNA(Asn)/Glu-tRNA(Gln) amidotransferase A subunit family amidase
MQDTVLAGLPVLIKDETAVADVRMTMGTKLFESNVPFESHPMVQAIERNGGVVIGMTNMPEFGAGSNTFNDVFGDTTTPFDTRRSAGGSSGGSACALASGQAWLASGSDLGGSLRIPASFCGVVGMRPSPDLLPQEDDIRNGVDELVGLKGPMARNVADLALFIDAMGTPPPPPITRQRGRKHQVGDCSGPEDGEGAGDGDGTAGSGGGGGGGRAGVSAFECDAPPVSWLDLAARAATTAPVNCRVLWSPDLGSTCNVEPATRRVCCAAVDALESVGAIVTRADVNTDAQRRLHEVRCHIVRLPRVPEVVFSCMFVIGGAMLL